MAVATLLAVVPLQMVGAYTDKVHEMPPKNRQKWVRLIVQAVLVAQN